MKRQSIFPIRGLTLVGPALSALSLAGCQNAGMDSEAFHSTNGDRHSFIVSHVFNKNIYEEKLSTPREGEAPELSIGDDLGQSPSTLFTCFYEIELSQSELGQCAQAASSPDSTLESLPAVQTIDIWRLMAHHQDKTRALTEYIVPNKQLLSEARENWTATPETQSLIVQGEESDEARHEVAESARPHVNPLEVPSYAIFGGIGAGINQLISQHLPRVTGRLINTVSCLAIGLTSDNSAQKIVESTLQAFNPMLGTASIPVNLGFGILKGLTGFLGKVVGAEKIAATHCGRAAANAITEEAKSSGSKPTERLTVDTESNAPLAIQAAEAIKQNNNERLEEILDMRELLSKEMERSTKSLRAGDEDFKMNSTLSENYQNVSHRNMEELKSNLRTLSQKIGNETGRAMCPRPEVFVSRVLIPALRSVEMSETGSEIPATQVGCNAASIPNTESSNESRRESQRVPEESSIASEDRSELRETISQLQKNLNQATKLIGDLCKSRPDDCNLPAQ